MISPAARFFRGLFRKTNIVQVIRSRPQLRDRAYRPQLELLEDRTVPSSTGTIHLTDPTISIVNDTHFDAKSDVFVYANGLDDGVYDVEVVQPGGKSGGGDLVLGVSSVSEPIHVVGGHFAPGSPGLTSGTLMNGASADGFRLWDEVFKNNGDPGYDDTLNNGNEYQVVIAKHIADETAPNFDNPTAKSKNFKADEDALTISIDTTFTLAPLTGSTVSGPAPASDDVTSAALGSTAQDFGYVHYSNGAIITTGTVSFVFYRGDSPTGTPVGDPYVVSVDRVTGAFDGPTESLLGAGDYYFIATWTSDDGSQTAVGDAEAFTINKGTLTLTTTIHNAAGGADVTNGSVALGTSVYDTSDVQGAVAGFDYGTITYTFNGAAAGSGLKSDTQPPLHAGDYTFQASLADSANYDVNVIDPEYLTVNKGTLTLTTTIHNAAGGADVTNGSVALGTSVYDTSDVQGAVAGFGYGTITYTFNTAGAGSGLTSDTEGPLHAGDYIFQASLAASADYDINPIAAENLHVNKGTLTLTTTIHNAADGSDVTNGSVALGTSAYDTTAVQGAVAGFAYGTINYTFNAVAAGSGLTSVTEGPLHAGNYTFQASLAASSDYDVNAIAAENLTVNQASTTTVTQVLNASNQDVTTQYLDPGTVVHDHATVASANTSFTITGTVTFTWYNTYDCTGTAVGTVTVAVGVDSTTWIPPSGAHSYCAVYNGSNDYSGSTGAAEPFTILSRENGLTMGYYSNKNGQLDLTGSSSGTTLKTTIYNKLFGVVGVDAGVTVNGALVKPGSTTLSVLVDATGKYEPLAWFHSYANIKSFLAGGATATNMANMLSAQMLTTEFNIVLGRVDPTKSIYVPAVTLPGTSTHMSSTLQNSLATNGVSTGGVATIQTIVDKTIAELIAHSNTNYKNPTAAQTATRNYQEALKDCFDAINNNEYIFLP